jgi:hypothetical protein
LWIKQLTTRQGWAVGTIHEDWIFLQALLLGVLGVSIFRLAPFVCFVCFVVQSFASCLA